MIKAIKQYATDPKSLFLEGALFALLGATFLVRLINLNYNSAFTDEAIYVIIGKLGVFQNDWWSYNPASWLAGLPYLYPSIAAITYALGGITGSRLFNILLNVLLVALVFQITRLLLRKKSEMQQVVGAGIAALIAGGAGIGIVVSRLATYDMPSYTLFFLSLYFLLRAWLPRIQNGRSYFYAAFFLLLATLTKIIIGVYVPFVIVYSFLASRRLSKKHFNFYLKYFLLPIIAGFVVYAATQYGAVMNYAGLTSGREKESLLSLATIVWEQMYFVIVLWVVATIGMLSKKSLKNWGVFSLLSLIVLLPHFLTQRASATMEKHTYLSIALLAPVIGAGLTNLYTMPKQFFMRFLYGATVFTTLITFLAVSYIAVTPYNEMWMDTRPYKTDIQANILKDDKILSETGTPFILDTFDYMSKPHNVTTFDYFVYRGKTGDRAYAEAVRDGYFDVIQLTNSPDVMQSFAGTRAIVTANLKDNYKKVYEKDQYILYRRVY